MSIRNNNGAQKTGYHKRGNYKEVRICTSNQRQDKTHRFVLRALSHAASTTHFSFQEEVMLERKNQDPCLSITARKHPLVKKKIKKNK